MRYTVTGGIPSEWIQSAYGAFRITVKDVFQKRIDVDTASEIVFSFTRELVEHSFSDQIRRVLSNAACDISDASPQHSDLIRKIWEGVKNLCQTAEEEEWQELNRPSAAA
ncbi:MAG: hypothetical protein WC457_00685 [Patescibacteria group bacterium]